MTNIESVHVSARKLSVRKKSARQSRLGERSQPSRTWQTKRLAGQIHARNKTSAARRRRVRRRRDRRYGIKRATRIGWRDKAEHDLNTPRGVTAFLVWIAREYPQVACAMLARMN